MVPISAQHTGSLLADSASLLDEGGDTLARVGVQVGHTASVLHSASTAVQHGGHLASTDTTFLQRAQRNLLCGLVCPIRRPGPAQRQCRLEHCDNSQPQPQPEGSEAGEVPAGQARTVAPPGESEASERVDERVTASLLDMGAHLLSAATNILTDIAFIKLKILQGLFSHPDCWVTPKNDNNQCISKLCNYTEQAPKVYMDNFGVCITNQAREWVIYLLPILLFLEEIVTGKPLLFLSI